MKEALEKIIKACTPDAEPIDMFGWSRGGATALRVADQLADMVKAKKLNAEIRFMGLIDPVATGIGIVKTEIVPSIVKTIWLGIRKKWDDPAIFTVMKLYREGMPRVQIKPDKIYDLSHEKTGFDETVAKDIYDAAKNAGVPLGPLPPHQLPKPKP